jgi:solute carrier family 25 aspartate/glutamate transporter 12/13
MYTISRNADLVERIVAVAGSSSPDGSISQKDFEATANRLSNGKLVLTPDDIDILFRLAGSSGSSDRLTTSSFVRFFDFAFDGVKSAKGSSVTTGLPKGSEMLGAAKTHAMGSEVLRSVYNFTLGSVAGAIGATFVYPIGKVDRLTSFNFR